MSVFDRLGVPLNYRHGKIVLTHEEAAEILREFDKMEATIEVYKEREKWRHEQDTKELRELKAQRATIMGMPVTVGYHCGLCGVFVAPNTIHMCAGLGNSETITVGEDTK